jgi:16S rRNA A1518/A1519 N6-dimethyltransferase RsmA/KsgA/DIM1 with predicted DNA glycosylase/AP lyase activity
MPSDTPVRLLTHGSLVADATARRIVEALTDRGVDGATVLEIGDGIGEIQIELLNLARLGASI